MTRQIQITNDGSHTMFIPSANITYHSTHGAIQESMHVFIAAGLQPLAGKNATLRIFEMGFGTGLNALLALRHALQNNQQTEYTALELFPLEEHEYKTLNYCKQLNDMALQPYFLQMHASGWGRQVQITPLFFMEKIRQSLTDWVASSKFHCIFFDAFAPNDQPELWTKEIFEKMFAMLANGGILVTYCSKGDVRRALKATGFAVQKLPGPPGKKEIIRALKRV